ncbi:MAG: hypothetical protein OEQ39_04645 [Gammaproteobacteria bacterium]|nr:hypothetical protein [Gammaproteobacteria bacterium]MDH3467683.1 hypothetical protein [Gammaproteobacteria bacterium]
MFEIVLILIVGGVIASIIDWRSGVYLTVLAGFLQDPIRKILPGESVYFVILVSVFVAATFVGFLLRKGPISLSPIYYWYPPLQLPVFLFIGIVGLQSIMTVVLWNNPILALLGLASYLSPFAALLLAFYLIRSVRDIEKFLIVYAAVGTLFGLSIFLSFLNIDWRVLREVGEGIIIYDLGTIITANPGLMRSPEIAAWHSATAACVIAVLATSRGTKSGVITGGILIAILVAAILMTGRRKMLMELGLFISIYSMVLLYFRRRMPAYLVVIAGVGVLAVWFAIEVVFPGGYGREFELYLQRGVSVFDESLERLTGLGIASIKWAINRVGIMGVGAGVSAQGSQYFGGGTVLVGGAGEAGLGRIVLELGVIGLGIMIWLLIAFIRYLWLIITEVSAFAPAPARLIIGIAAILVANVPVFIVAAQAYGDPFVLLLVGWLLGFILSVPRIMLNGELQSTGSRDEHMPSFV